jgi:hypothetical protein
MIVAEGTFTQLTRQFLGAPRWELRLATAAAAAVEFLDGLVYIDRIDGECVYYHTDDAHHANPQLVARLTAAGIPIVALNELPRRLEDVYLEIVAGNDRTTARSGTAHQPADTLLVDQPAPEMAESR